MKMVRRAATLRAGSSIPVQAGSNPAGRASGDDAYPCQTINRYYLPGKTAAGPQIVKIPIGRGMGDNRQPVIAQLPQLDVNNVCRV